MDVNPTLAAKRVLRTKFMNWLYEATDGSELASTKPEAFLNETATADDPDAVRALADAIKFLEGEYLIEATWTMGELPFDVSLTHAGVVEIEEAMARPDRPTEHFVPIINVTTVQGSIIGSQIQQGSPGASQSGTITVNQRERFQAFIHAARQAAEVPELDSDDRVKVTADLDFMEKELAKTEPRWERLKVVGTAVQTILLGGLGDALGGGIASLPWHDAIASLPWS